jgi:hypothetical protein
MLPAASLCPVLCHAMPCDVLLCCVAVWSVVVGATGCPPGQGRGLATHAYTHSLETAHHMFMKLDNGKVWWLAQRVLFLGREQVCVWWVVGGWGGLMAWGCKGG